MFMVLILDVFVVNQRQSYCLESQADVTGSKLAPLAVEYYPRSKSRG